MGKNVVVIGSGPGGAAFAALMSHAGHGVTLLERNHFTGGKCSSLPRRGLVVDTGVHMFGRGPLGPFGEISRILGEGPRWSRVVPSFTVDISGRGRLDMGPSISHPLSITSNLMGRVMGWQNMRLFSTVRGAAARMGLRGFLSFLRRANDSRCPLFSEEQDTPVRDFLMELTPSSDLLRMMHCQIMLTTVTPWSRASLGEFAYILASANRARHLCYPMGGSGEIPASYIRAMKRRGGRLMLGCEAAGVQVEEGRVKGVLTGDGDLIPADIVVSNAGLKRTVQLAGCENFSPDFRESCAGLRESEAFVAVKFTLDRAIRSMRAPCLLHLPDLPPDNMFDYLEDGGVPSDLFLFVTAPSLWDASLVPPGRDLLIVGVPAPSGLDRTEHCERLLDAADLLAQDIFPELKSCVLEKERVHTAHVSRLSGRASGECIGLAQEVGQSGSRRPNQALPVKGLYLVGSDAGGRGIGTECAADSALRLYNLLKYA